MVEDVLTAISAKNYGEASPNIGHNLLASMEAIQFLVRLSKNHIGQSDSLSENVSDEVTSSIEPPPEKLNYFQFFMSKIPEMFPFAKLLVR